MECGGPLGGGRPDVRLKGTGSLEFSPTVIVRNLWLSLVSGRTLVPPPAFLSD